MFYDGTKLLSIKDLNGETPEIFISTSNRSAGKTTYFNRLAVNKFKKEGSKFCLVYRYNYELDDCADKFFKDINGLFFHGDVMKSERRASGIYHELFLNDESCGYAVSINGADPLKKYAHLLSDVDRIIFDEFQSESNHYCSDEVRKFISVKTSISRGHGKQSRYVPVYMISNPVSIINPYYVSMGISERLNTNVNFLRGDGWVLEQGFNESASNAQLESAFNRAFKNESYIGYAAQGIYLNDSKAFIEKPAGRGRYICTVKYNGANYGVREYAESGVIYADDNPDYDFNFRISVTTDDHQINYVMLKKNNVMIGMLRWYFDHGCFRFKNLRCKEAILKALSY